MKYIYNIDNLKNHNENTVFEEKIGKKAQNLLELATNGFNVPYFSVITNRYFKEIILKEIEKHNQEAGNNDEIKDWDAVFSGNAERKIENIIRIIKNHKIRKEFEKEIGHKLPEDFRWVLLNVSSHLELFWNLYHEDEELLELPKELVEIFSGNLYFGIDTILSCEDSRKGWIDICYPDYNNSYDKIFHNKLAFQKVSNGDLFAIDLEEESYGKI